MVAHTYGLSNHTVQTGGLEVQDQPEIQSCPFHIYTYIPTPMHTHTHTHMHIFLPEIRVYSIPEMPLLWLVRVRV